MTTTDRRGLTVGDTSPAVGSSDPSANLAIKTPVRVATTANIVLSGLQSIDDVTVVADDRVLVKDQNDTTQNGIYLASSGNWTRSTDLDSVREAVKGTLLFVNEGTEGTRTAWLITSSDPVVPDAALTFTEYAQPTTAPSSNLLRSLPHLAKKLYTGAARSGVAPDQTLSALTINTLNWVVFGDSVGGTKEEWVGARLRKGIGRGGGLYSGATVSGSATLHSDVTDCAYWINGQWWSIPASGSGIVTFDFGSGSPRCDRIKIFYVKRFGAGTFKVQTETGGVWSDAAGFTNVDASNTTITAGICNITIAIGDHQVRVVALTGTVEIINAGYIDASVAGLAYWGFTASGLALAKSNDTPVAAVNTVLNAISPDILSMEFKDDTAFPAAFATFMTNLESNLTAAHDWVLIGTTPESNSTADANSVANNAVISQWVDDNYGAYFDAYSPFGSYAALNALGWGGDGTHPATAAQLFLASMLWNQLGLDDLQISYQSRDWQVSNGYVRDKIYIGNTSSQSGSFGTNTDRLDSIIQGYRTILFQDMSGNNKGLINTGGGYFTTFGTVLGLVAPFATSGPCLRADGNDIYASDLSPGDGSTYRQFKALSFQYLVTGAPQDLAGAGTPEGSVTATVGSTYRRTNGGAGTSFYVKESGTGNTGWVGK